eukprot:Blabericola_migrator_1__13390@NODE_954_length_5901_cov_132_878985_g662_i0_p3_GENE_NODE_954_length_5901_cov_132_878985_g662_i0NODE_954_length_5901_cov_132_878985_g662_i0_p3_ORF_typecomplete_len295_score44_04Nudc_N/PF14050_6/6_4e09CS/PF04969_16/0_0003_NODE_954_length_5901_cov_132_878985_g662_i048995783
MEDRIDECMLEIAHLSGGRIEAVLDNIFSFFRRRTDLYVLSDGERGKPGFMPGQAEKMIMAAYHNQWRIANSYVKPNIERPRAPLTPNVATPPKDSTPQKVTDVSTPKKSFSSGENVDSVELRPPTISLANGGSADVYHWHQDATSISMELPLQAGVTRHDLEIEIKGDYVYVAIPQTGFEFARQPLYPLDPSESNWFIVANSMEERSLFLELSKKEAGWWEAVFREDKERYPCKRLEPKQNIQELPEADQMQIERTIHEHVRKEKGIKEPTVEELEIEEALEKARFLPGSPLA